jgi:hypothetical protein
MPAEKIDPIEFMQKTDLSAPVRLGFQPVQNTTASPLYLVGTGPTTRTGWITGSTSTESTNSINVE